MSSNKNEEKKTEDIREQAKIITEEELAQIAKETKEEFEQAGYTGEDEQGILFGRVGKLFNKKNDFEFENLAAERLASKLSNGAQKLGDEAFEIAMEEATKKDCTSNRLGQENT